MDRRQYREEYLTSEHWRVTRLAALERAGHRCQVCNSPDKLDVHHRTYERLGNERPEDLTVLCRRCHDLFHGSGQPAPKGKKARKRQGTRPKPKPSRPQAARHLPVLRAEAPSAPSGVRAALPVGLMPSEAVMLESLRGGPKRALDLSIAIDQPTGVVGRALAELKRKKCVKKDGKYWGLTGVGREALKAHGTPGAAEAFVPRHIREPKDWREERQLPRRRR